MNDFILLQAQNGNMTTTRHFLVQLMAFAVLMANGCGGSTSAPIDSGADDASTGEGGDATDSSLPSCPGPTGPQPGPPQGASVSPTSKLDVLFVVRNSVGMDDVQNLLGQSVPSLIARLLSPNCLDAQNDVIGPSQNGACASGHLEFQPVHDMHVGIITSSLGGLGGDICRPDTMNLANPSLNAHDDDRGELINRGGTNETDVTDADPSHLLAWFPSVPQNQGQPAPPVAPLGDPSKLTGDLQSMLSGAGDHGCGLSAQLESWYRFLVQPDPYDQVVVSSARAQLMGTDATLLRQRHDFLRPDSAVVIVDVTNRNDRAVDPRTIGAQGWAFENSSFPGSPNGAAPEG